ncbi:gluconate 2-dehydrogenase subunit 3 family protein [Paenibacillus sacheonensis]|uniref:Twin-arginine translocation signal domain-containing protein n=1 Tax=Paenibacillus sacheonensis TaxID=742054 RepID=A0A7X5BYI2_9BACL|nr:gluconate 2-dehydrogenase subunit 3 family protein [Paenibacillus sacheonensis]MBM7565601.1 gluconate 2-dehydrogenase gamma chain [Paenibacillus sacheonensis]NBC69481.1 twin-arginine translocation signal domain-containing protein [Paenibacillus sacheonensis]
MANKNESSQQPRDESRRQFLKYSGTAIGGVVVGGVIGGLIGANANTDKKDEAAQPDTGKPAKPADRDYNQALMFFNQDQFMTAEAASERIYPKDDSGPGAKELGVAFFIDHQMASAYGMNAREYMSPPFYKSEATQGYQLSFKRRELVALGLDSLNVYSMDKYQKGFPDLAPEEQDKVLGDFEQDAVNIKGVPASTFFAYFLNLTIEGVYADPLYGGNKNMDGWRMRNYPGNQMSFTEQIDKDDFVKMEPLSLSDHLEIG